jgi:hypothetical protein
MAMLVVALAASAPVPDTGFDLTAAAEPVGSSSDGGASPQPLEAGFPATGQAPPLARPHADLEKLAFLIGNWDIQIEGLDQAGKVRHRSTGRLESTWQLGGQLLLSLGYAADSQTAQRNWKFYNKAKQKLYDVNFDLAGNFEVREAAAQGPDVAFALVDPFRGTDGVPRNWRKTYHRISPDAYEVLTDYSEDGVSWVLAFRERYTRQREGNR